MKTDYLALALAEQAAEHLAQGYCPLSFDAPATRFVLRDTAERALALQHAAAQTEKNRLLLAAAVRHAKSFTPPADVPTPTNEL